MYFQKNKHIIKISAWNTLKDKLIKGSKDTVNTEVVIKLPSSKRPVSINRNSSLDTLQLADGREAWAVIKASKIMAVVE